jgi:type IV secretion system protein VirD4
LLILSTIVPAHYFTAGMIWVVVGYFVANISLGAFMRKDFRNWQNGFNNAIIQGQKFGTARFAFPHELEAFVGKQGFYIGGDYTFDDKGHILTVAGTRGGKGTNLIIPNLLGVGGYQGSWVVIDPKGENAAITARYQREQGQNVVILNPWGLLAENVGEAQSYNPLDILADTSNINLVDDAQMIAEMIVPIDKNDHNKFFTDNARAIVAGLLLHMATDQYDSGELRVERSLTTLWQWVRLPEDKWLDLVANMNANDHELFSDTIRQAANEIEKLMKAGDKTWGNIIATILQCTDFIKSPALQKSMETGFDPKTLSDGKTTLYIIIPVDKLQSHARWLRLIVTTTMRAVVRKPNKRVCFLLDEFAALGYLPEIETALSTYAGFEITVWPILQSLIQLQSHYKDNWETFVGNSTIRQFFSVNDNFTAEYASKAIGATSHVISNVDGFNISGSQANQRYLVTPDELRRASGQYIFSFITDRPVTYYQKQPYYQMPLFQENGKERYDKNPYFEQ